MPLETATYISQLVNTNPAHTDAVSQGDAHIRLIKAVLLSQFPNFTAVALASTEAQLDAAANAVINGAFSFAAGTAALPKLNVVGDTTTGFYQSAAGALDVTTSGVRRATWSASGLNVIAALTAAGVTSSSGLTVSAGGASITGNVNIVSGGTFQVGGVNLLPLVYANIQNVTAARLLGNPTGLAAAPSEIALGNRIAFSGTTLKPNPTAPNIQVFTSGSALTYTTPTDGGDLPLYLRVRMVGGGGGGTGGGTGGSNGGSGGTTSFGSWTAAFGTGGAGVNPGTGGSGGTNGTGTVIRRIPGQTPYTLGGNASFFGGGGARTASGTVGTAAVANTGSGGGGYTDNVGGGGAGEFVEFIVTAPAASYSYTVGAGGTAGGGTSVGGAGAAGRIEVEAYWQ